MLFTLPACPGKCTQAGGEGGHHHPVLAFVFHKDALRVPTDSRSASKNVCSRFVGSLLVTPGVQAIFNSLRAKRVLNPAQKQTSGLDYRNYCKHLWFHYQLVTSLLMLTLYLSTCFSKRSVGLGPEFDLLVWWVSYYLLSETLRVLFWWLTTDTSKKKKKSYPLWKALNVRKQPWRTLQRVVIDGQGER